MFVEAGRLADLVADAWQSPAFKHATKVGTVTIAGRMSKDLSPAMRDSILKQAGLEKGAL